MLGEGGGTLRGGGLLEGPAWTTRCVPCKAPLGGSKGDANPLRQRILPHNMQDPNEL